MTNHGGGPTTGDPLDAQAGSPSGPTHRVPGTPHAVVAHFFSRLPVGTLLNLGAGSTSLADRERQVIGVDIEPPDVTSGIFVRADAARLPFDSNTFDGALLKDIVEHVADPIAVLREVRRVVRPGATILLTTPRAIPRAVWDDPTHIRGFTRRALCTLIDRSGWQLTYGPRRIGSPPGAGHLGLVPHLETILAVPGFGHWFGTNWIIEATPAG